MFTHHDGVHYQRKGELAGGMSYRFHHLDGAERAGLGSGRRNIFDHRGDLFQYQPIRHRFHARHAYGVLYGQQGNHGFAVHAELVESLEVSLYAGAAAGIGSRDGEGHWRRTAHDSVYCAAVTISAPLIRLQA